MREILGNAKTIRTLLNNTKYSIDYYQREYKWGEKEVEELIDDLTSRFLQDYEPSHSRQAVSKYGHYFLGSIIISKKDSQSFIVDGQQRLTSLTLLLIYLHNLQRTRHDVVKIDDLIFSEQYGQKTFNLNIEERTPCMEAMFDGRTFDTTDQVESVQNIVQRYEDIKRNFPEELLEVALPYFVDWLIENVHLVEITAYSDDDAYTIFETMNDRGLSLSHPDMLKGYLLANITDSKKRESMNDLWKKRELDLKKHSKEADTDFFKAWLRSQYANTIRERKKDAHPGEFDLIGSEFHRWVRSSHERLGLTNSNAYVQFISSDYSFYSRQYMRLMQATDKLTPGLEHIYYNAKLGFTTQYQLLLASLIPTDTEEIINRKFKLVGQYLDILLNRRLWNWHTISYSTMQYAMFLVMRDIRQNTPEELIEHLYIRLKDEKENFTSNNRFDLNQRNRFFVHVMLARMTDYIEQRAGMPSRYLEYISGMGQKKYEIEHIWANKPDRHRDEFAQPADFLVYRNRIGGLLLLPKSFNASYGALTYEEKLPHYNAQNLLARSLNPQSYEHNPGFMKLIEQSKLPFKPYTNFHKEQLDARQELYCYIAEQTWNPEQLLTI